MKNVGAGSVCFDIGANKGGWTYWLRKAVGKSGRVFAFEPQPALFAYLDGLLSSRYWSNVTVEQVALSDQAGSLEMFIPGQPGSTSPGASLKQDVLSQETNVHTARVSTTTLDDYAKKSAIEGIDFVKIDVEGSELDVIKGARDVLADQRASWIIESEARHIGESGVLELFSRMERAGHDGYFFSPEGLTPLDQFSFSKHQRQDTERFWSRRDYCNNFLFTRR